MKIFSALAGLFFSGCVIATPLNNLVVFGDSLSDNGNLYEYMKRQLPVSPPYYSGRFSNGPVWIELVAKNYYPNDTGSHLQDYAFGGAGVLGEGEDSDDSLFTLQSEIESYLLAHQDKADEQSLFVVWIGANNYLAIPDDWEAAIKRVNSGIKSSLAKLANKGAKHILVVNLPDLGRTPIARDFEAIEVLTAYSKRHNAVLAQEIEHLQSLYPDVQWVYLDVDKILGDVFTEPEKYGFTNITDTCYEALMDEPSGQETILRMVSRVKPKIEADACTGYLFFDPVHPTAPAHQIMAEKAKEILARAGIEFK
ncbi:GDSL family lysophospholipase PlaA [Legionella londiniensis]|uniref:Lysophospholipase A n=1 Tax=Legionella londiniensis TaxID=45068 RepID=A0A0W0VTK4_9GAMM|nr:SGNH/GDSL hydrolase family protein [Legionella londiniensis]KTD23193.1 lysophospholipase A [Legionella londiniensis]STX93796.1 lysophospholipase A [Legionella londiniensis]